MNVDQSIRTWIAEFAGTTADNIKSYRFEEEGESYCGEGTCHFPAIREVSVAFIEPVPLPHFGNTAVRIIDLESEGIDFPELLRQLIAIGDRT